MARRLPPEEKEGKDRRSKAPASARLGTESRAPQPAGAFHFPHRYAVSQGHGHHPSGAIAGCPLQGRNYRPPRKHESLCRQPQGASSRPRTVHTDLHPPLHTRELRGKGAEGPLEPQLQVGPGAPRPELGLALCSAAPVPGDPPWPVPSLTASLPPRGALGGFRASCHASLTLTSCPVAPDRLFNQSAWQAGRLPVSLGREARPAQSLLVLTPGLRMLCTEG